MIQKQWRLGLNISISTTHCLFYPTHSLLDSIFQKFYLKIWKLLNIDSGKGLIPTGGSISSFPLPLQIFFPLNIHSFGHCKIFFVPLGKILTKSIILYIYHRHLYISIHTTVYFIYLPTYIHTQWYQQRSFFKTSPLPAFLSDPYPFPMIDTCGCSEVSERKNFITFCLHCIMIDTLRLFRSLRAKEFHHFLFFDCVC